VSQEQAKATTAVVQQPVARVATQADNRPVLQVAEGFDLAWRRVGLSLDRTGFTVEDRDRAQGIYFVRYVEPTADKKDPGFFAKLFRSSSTPTPLKYRIVVSGQGNASTVSVLNAEGTPDTSVNAKRIVQLIADDLK
jgi:outer membrane protein assembly factor BamC